MDIKFRTALVKDKELIIFERADFEAFLDHTAKCFKEVGKSFDEYFGRINFIIDEKINAERKVQTKDS